MGHALAIGKNNDDELIVFDPQQLGTYKGEENIRYYLVNVLKAIKFTAFCNKDEKKRKNDGFDSIKKNHVNEPGFKIPKKSYQKDVHEPSFTEDVSFSHGIIPTKPKPSKESILKSRRDSKRKKNNGGKRKTKNSKRKTKNAKRKTKNSKRKTKNSKRKTKNSKRK